MAKRKRKTVIDIRGLWAGYGREPILEDLDLKVYNDDFLGIIGPNGGGKSTLLKVILGLLPPQKGKVKVFGRSPIEARKYIGYVPQFAVYDKDFPINVWDVVMMGRRSRRGLFPFYNAEDKQKTKEALEAVDMLEFRKEHIDDLSGGQRQRVFVARALASDPKLLILDEPTASVDSVIQESIYQLLQRINEGIPIILVTHDIGVIAQAVTRIACLNKSLHTGDGEMLTKEQLESAYQCPVELIAHGVPHRVLPEHKK